MAVHDGGASTVERSGRPGRGPARRSTRPKPPPPPHPPPPFGHERTARPVGSSWSSLRPHSRRRVLASKGGVIQRVGCPPPKAGTGGRRRRPSTPLPWGRGSRRARSLFVAHAAPVPPRATPARSKGAAGACSRTEGARALSLFTHGGGFLEDFFFFFSERNEGVRASGTARRGKVRATRRERDSPIEPATGEPCRPASPLAPDPPACGAPSTLDARRSPGRTVDGLG